MKEILIATNNPGKVKEYAYMLNRIGYSVKSLADFGNIEIEENGSSFAENALIKAHALYDITGIMCIADDSGLEIEALDNKPGIYSARWYGDLNPYDKNEKVLELLKDATNRRARFYCDVAVVSDKEEKVFEGILNGEIATEQRGENGFGFDPIFISDIMKKTNAELTPDEKNAISHRGQALRQALAYLESLHE